MLMRKIIPLLKRTRLWKELINQFLYLKDMLRYVLKFFSYFKMKQKAVPSKLIKIRFCRERPPENLGCRHEERNRKTTERM